MSLSDALAALRRARTIHAETLPTPGVERQLWQAERQVFDALEKQMLERLNLRREVRV